MPDFDLLVIGGGTGNTVAAAGAAADLETALVEPGPLGGTCLNRGCNPSKMLLQAANAANDVRDAEKFHIDAELNGIGHERIVDEMDGVLSRIASDMEDRYRDTDGLTLFDTEAEFVAGTAERTESIIAVNGETVSADKVVIATGSRPIIPPINGLDDVDYLTSEEALYQRDQPDNLIILGGGYIAVELGYYFESVGTAVSIVEMEETLLPREDGHVAKAFTEIAESRHDINTDHRVTAVDESADGYRVMAETSDGGNQVIEGDAVLVALGRRPNSDTLNLEATEIETDDAGFIPTNEYLETSVENVWAQGDVAGNALFKHSGDYETQHTIANAVHDRRRSLDLTAMPHTIFTEPQIAGVGATEDELIDAGQAYGVGRANYADSAMGRAKKLDHGFLKVLAAPDGEILGCHVIGAEASALLHEVVVAMRTGVTVEAVADTIHAHPTLNKVVESAFKAVGS